GAEPVGRGLLAGVVGVVGHEDGRGGGEAGNPPEAAPARHAARGDGDGAGALTDGEGVELALADDDGLARAHVVGAVQARAALAPLAGDVPLAALGGLPQADADGPQRAADEPREGDTALADAEAGGADGVCGEAAALQVREGSLAGYGVPHGTLGL